MFSEEVVVKVQNISKSFEIYEKPVYRLYQTLCAGYKKFYKDFWALKGINFEVCKGECVGIIGRNGSGKSTLLQIITGTLQPTSGNVEVYGRVGALLELGNGFNPDFTGKENVYLNASILGLSKKEIDSKYQEIIDFAAIGDFINQPVKTYSSGMMVRLAFATVTASIPEIMIIDEALAVGDAFFQQKCIRFIKEKLKNTTKFLVSHDLSMLQAFADRVIVLEHGEIVFDGLPLDAIKFYTKQLIQESLDNIHEIENHPVEGQMALHDLPTNINSTALVGSGLVNIYYCQVLINGKEQRIASAGDEVRISLAAQMHVESMSVIVGYFFRDRTGNQIFGSNTDLSDIRSFSCSAGNLFCTWKFHWPDVRAGDYFLTLGIGDGNTSTQLLHCWAQNITAITGVQARAEGSVVQIPMMEFKYFIK